MIPVLPSTTPPCQSIVATLGFQSPHVDMSDQIFQIFSAGAVVSTEVPYSAIPRSFPCAGDCRSLFTTTNRAARNRPASLWCRSPDGVRLRPSEALLAIFPISEPSHHEIEDRTGNDPEGNDTGHPVEL